MTYEIIKKDILGRLGRHFHIHARTHDKNSSIKSINNKNIVKCEIGFAKGVPGVPNNNDYRLDFPETFVASNDEGPTSLAPQMQAEASQGGTSTCSENKNKCEPITPECNQTPAQMPYINNHGSLVIPFDSNPQYHYWKQGGQALTKTLEQLNASEEIIKKYKSIYIN